MPLARAPGHQVIHGDRVGDALSVHPVLSLLHEVRQGQLDEYHHGTPRKVDAHAAGGDGHQRHPAVVVVFEPVAARVALLTRSAPVEAYVRKVRVVPISRHLSQHLVLDVVHHQPVVGEYHSLGHLLERVGVRPSLILVEAEFPPIPLADVAALLDAEEILDPFARAPGLREPDCLHLRDGTRAVRFPLAVHAVVLEVHPALLADVPPRRAHVVLRHVDVHLVPPLGG